MSNPERKKLRTTGEPTLAMVAEMERIKDELHHLGDEMLLKVNSLLRAESAEAEPHPDPTEPPEYRRSA